MRELELSTEWLEPIEAGRESPVKLTVPRLVQPQYDIFFKEFLSANQPCVVAAASASWPCTELWLQGNQIDFRYLTATYGDLTAPLTDCDNFDQNPKESTVRDYMAYLSVADGSRTACGKLLYLKDWHLRRQRPSDSFYTVPTVFASDWLNEYSLDKCMDDFMFVYIGPKGSWTPLHSDVYSSFSWSVNVVGRKRWLMLPPGEEHKLRDPVGQLPPSFRPRPGLRYLEVTQDAGDAVFVPSGWHHVVYNELDTVSVNHNWVNGCNVHIVWRALREALARVQKEIQHLKDDDGFVEDCQRMLKCDHGMNYAEFADFIMHIGDKRLRQARGESVSLPGEYRLGPRHVRFDLCAALHVLRAITTDPHTTDIIERDVMSQLGDVRDRIEKTVEN